MADVFDSNNDFAIDLLPDDGIDLDLDALYGDFGDEFDIATEDGIPTEELDPVPYGKSWAWDFSNGQFLKYGSQPAQTNGLDTLKTWINKTMLTARAAHIIYDDTYGVDEPDSLIGNGFDASAQNQWSENVRESLLEHDRISDVVDFVFVEEGEYLEVSFSIITDEDDQIDIEGLNLG